MGIDPVGVVLGNLHCPLRLPHASFTSAEMLLSCSGGAPCSPSTCSIPGRLPLSLAAPSACCPASFPKLCQGSRVLGRADGLLSTTVRQSRYPQNSSHSASIPSPLTLSPIICGEDDRNPDQ